jgi:hypothetical protein|tara:strand:+ start:151 stop:471 length:321 start_codon:yes stop_codon:yes gene_type:complete
MSATIFGPYLVKRLTASGVVTAAGVGGYVKAFGITGAAAASSVTLKDGGASGAAGPELKIDSSVAANATRTIPSGDIGPIRFNTDIYCTIAGTGTVAWVVYSADSL